MGEKRGRRCRRPDRGELTVMTDLPEVVSGGEWPAARTEPPAAQQEFTRARDRDGARRRWPPMVRVGKPYAVDGPRRHAVHRRGSGRGGVWRRARVTLPRGTPPSP
ncbi:DUF899 family protein [Streptomyces sp. NPDC047706]|uniref:DUF899 family protein n=1 Tax=Streptomyces sp. NPDC047706 TaxID=3365486 RepID=UPI00371537CD